MGEQKGSAKPKGDKRQRLAEQLRANLQRRKAQARSRREGEADGRQGIAAAATPEKREGD